MNDYQRILIFNVNWLGDVLFSTAAIRNIRRNFPKSFIACVIPSRCYPVLKGNPHLDEIIIFDEKDRHKGMLDKLSFVRLLKSKKFDVVYLLHRSMSRALICRLAGIPERVGHYTKKRAFLLTKKIYPPERDSLHRIDYYLDILQNSGLKVEDRYPEFFVEYEDDEFVAEFLKKEGIKSDDFIVGLNPGGNWLPKRWPKENWALLADELISKLNFKTIFTGSTSDIALVKEIVNQMKEKPIVATAKFNLKQLGAFCKKLNLFVTADTGPLHIANAVGAKQIIALFGPTSPLITGPVPLRRNVILSKDVDCKVPCYLAECADNRCMKAITVEDVFTKIKELTQNNEQ